MAGSNHFWKPMWCGRKLKPCVLLILPFRADPCREGDWRSHTYPHQLYTHKNTTMAAFSSTCDSEASRTYRLREKETKSKLDVCGSQLEQSDCSTVLEKSQEFFQICDIEDKGFVTRRDMQVRHAYAHVWIIALLTVPTIYYMAQCWTIKAQA